MYINTAIAKLTMKGIELKDYRLAILSFIEKISKAEDENNLKTIEQVFKEQAKQYYTKKNELEDMQIRIKELELKSSEYDIALRKSLLDRTERTKLEIVEQANLVLDFNFENRNMTPKDTSSICSLVHILNIGQNIISINLFNNQKKTYANKVIPLGDVILDCYKTKKDFEKKQKDEALLNCTAKQEDKKEIKTNDIDFYIKAMY